MFLRIFLKLGKAIGLTAPLGEELLAMERPAHADHIAAGLLHPVHRQQALQRLGRAGAQVRVVNPPRGTHEHLCTWKMRPNYEGKCTTDAEWIGLSM